MRVKSVSAPPPQMPGELNTDGLPTGLTRSASLAPRPVSSPSMQVARAATRPQRRVAGGAHSSPSPPRSMATPGRRVRPASTLARLPHTLPTTASHAASTGGGQWRSGRAIAVSTFRPASVHRAQVLSTSYSRCWLSTQPDLDPCPHIGSLPPLCPSPHWPLPHGPRFALHRASPTE